MTRRQERDPKSRRWRLSSFLDAVNGLRILVCTQPNARFHLVASAGAIALAAWVELTAGEWAVLVLAITVVWVAEGLNTGIEFAVDLISPEHHKLAGWAKDVAAGAVLLASIGALVVGAILFLPKLVVLFGY